MGDSLPDAGAGGALPWYQQPLSIWLCIGNPKSEPDRTEKLGKKIVPGFTACVHGMWVVQTERS
jgi:hypothetical protein